MVVKKSKVENVGYSIATALSVIGAGLCIAGLLLPDWWEVKMIDGIVLVKVRMGPWQDEVCIGDRGCENFWIMDDDYDRPEGATFPDYKLIRGFLTAGVIAGILSLFCNVAFWCCLRRPSLMGMKRSGYVAFYSLYMVAGFFNLVGVLIVASRDQERGERDYAKWAPFLSGIGGALFLIAGCLSCVVCRYDASYGTLENPVSPAFDRA